jgi:hypothetical protein
MRLSAVLLAGLTLAAAVAAEQDVRIGARSDTAPKESASKEPTYEQLQGLVKRLSAGAAADKTPWEKSELPQTFVEEARANPELFSRLLIPPGYPKAVSRADAPLRARAARVLALAADYRNIQALVNCSVYDPEEKVRAAAADALVQMNEPVAMRKLVDLAIAPEYVKYPWAVRKNACQALKGFSRKEVAERLLRELSYELAGGNPLDSKNKPRGVAQGIGTDNPLMMPNDPVTVKLKDEDAYPVMSALKEITGAALKMNEKDMKSWREWWKTEGGK